jgi:hypothetical protein
MYIYKYYIYICIYICIYTYYSGASEALQLSDVTAFIMRRLTNSPINADTSMLTH